jgi:hypothetical protein
MEAKQVVALLDEAIELLDDLNGRLDMFENQRYWGLKKKVDRFKNIGEQLHTALDLIETADESADGQRIKASV